MNIASDITDLIGRTPLVRLDRLCDDIPGNVLGKLEAFNPGGSIKDRIGIRMIEAAESEGDLYPDTIIVEPTSGNTGVALAGVAAVKNYRLILTMPATMTQERRDLLTALGAELILTPAEEGMKGALRKARELKNKLGNVFIPSQFENRYNSRVHEETTAEEIWDATDGAVDMVVTGIGTGGTITGLGTALKKRNDKVLMIGVEPAESPYFTEGRAGTHHIEGIGAGFHPEVLDTSVVDEVITVTETEAFRETRRLARTEGILAGVSSGAAIHGLREAVDKSGKANTCAVAILPDTGERYLSTWGFRN